MFKEKILRNLNRPLLGLCLVCVGTYLPLAAAENIFDTKDMHSVEVVELQANALFKTWLTRHKDALILVTDYRAQGTDAKTSKIERQFMFTGMKKILYRGTQYELPEYRVYDRRGRKRVSQIGISLRQTCHNGDLLTANLAPPP